MASTVRRVRVNIRGGRIQELICNRGSGLEPCIRAKSLTKRALAGSSSSLDELLSRFGERRECVRTGYLNLVEASVKTARIAGTAATAGSHDFAWHHFRCR